MSLSLDISSLGFTIPQPLLQEIGSENAGHFTGESISTSNGISNTPINIGVHWHDQSDEEWLNHDPHVFMYLDVDQQTVYENVGEESGRYRNHRLIHPSTWNDGTLNGRTSPMFSKYSGGDHESWIPQQRPSEWPINSNEFYSASMQINPALYYGDNGRNPQVRTNDFFPISVDDWHNYNEDGNGVWMLGFKRGRAEYVGNQKCLIMYFRFVIRHPDKNDEPVVGPLSRKLVIGPHLGHFAEGMYYHKWKTEIE